MIEKINSTLEQVNKSHVLYAKYFECLKDEFTKQEAYQVMGGVQSLLSAAQSLEKTKSDLEKNPDTNEIFYNVYLNEYLLVQIDGILEKEELIKETGLKKEELITLRHTIKDQIKPISLDEFEMLLDQLYLSANKIENDLVANIIV